MSGISGHRDDDRDVPRDLGATRARGWRAWSTALYACICIGCISALFEWGWQPPLLCALAFGTLVGGVRALTPAEPTLALAVMDVARVATLAGLTCVAVVGIVEAFGALGTLMVLSLCCTHPVVLAWAGNVLRQAHGIISEGSVALAGEADLSSVTDEVLSQAWRRSLLSLTSAQSASARLRAVQEREVYLNEFSRRYPTAIEAWLITDARVSGDPLSLAPTRPQPPAAEATEDG
ncbi:MAG TPA: hypothetical protein VM688_10095 [Nocardioidaceae bacterium]|jgi:hypothetical protein|nr:hypothetical protein [Nocardioidaceae bacterium]